MLSYFYFFAFCSASRQILINLLFSLPQRTLPTLHSEDFSTWDIAITTILMTLCNDSGSSRLNIIYYNRSTSQSLLLLSMLNCCFGFTLQKGNH